MLDAGRLAAPIPGRAADHALQEQHRQQGRVVRRPRELPDAPVDAVRRHRAAPDAVLRQPAGRLRRRPGRHRPGRPRATASRSASAPTTSRSRSGSRRRSSGRSSTPATSRTPTPRSTAGCTSSSATPTSPRSRRTSRSARPSLVLAMIEDRLHRRPTSRVERPVRGAARGLARPDRCSTCSTLRDGRRLTAVQLQVEYLEQAAQVRRGPARLRRRRADASTCSPAGSRCSTRLERRPDAAARASSTGWPSSSCSRATATATASTGTAAKLQLIDLQYTDVRPEKGLYHRLVGAGRMERLLDDAAVERAVTHAAGGHPGLLPRPSACAVRGRRSPPRRGTRSSSTCPAASRCSGCRRSTRCAARRRTSAALLDRSKDATALVDALTGGH